MHKLPATTISCPWSVASFNSSCQQNIKNERIRSGFTNTQCYQLFTNSRSQNFVCCDKLVTYNSLAVIPITCL
jgi:hypothetical protein